MTAPPPAATGDETHCPNCEGPARIRPKDTSPGFTIPCDCVTNARTAMDRFRQRGEDLAALLRDAKDVQQKWCDESNRAIRIEEQLERARDYGRRWHEAALGRSGEIDTLKARVTELEAALSAATARAEEAEADLLSHLSTGRCVLIYSQKDLDAATDAKREACAKVCDGIAEKCEFVDSEASAEYISGARDCAAAIRARQARG